MKPLSSKELSTGPILVIDQKTFYVPNLIYEGDEDLHFCVENELRKPIILKQTLQSNINRNVYVYLDKDDTVDKIFYFGVCSLSLENYLTKIAVPHDKVVLEGLGYEKVTVS